MLQSLPHFKQAVSIIVVLAVMYLVNSNFVHTVFSCCVLFLCITSLLLDIGLVLAYLLFPGITNLLCKKNNKKHKTKNSS